LSFENAIAIWSELHHGLLGRVAEERYPNCREFVAALEEALTATDPRCSVTRTVPNRAPHRYIVGAGVAAILVMLLVIAWLGYKWLTRVPDIAQFSADPQAIEPGAQTTISWKVSGAAEVTIDPDIGKRPAADRVLVKPTKSTYYVLNAANGAGPVFQEVFVEVRRVTPLLLYLEGGAKLRRKQFAEGVALLRRAGESGETRAMMDLGDIFWEGKEGQTKDEPEAVRWFRKAAEAGDPDGMRDLGAFYDLGIGVHEDPTSAATWYRRAADRGNSDATLYLGSLYEEGRGVRRDLGKARELYRRAAKMGNADGQKQLIRLGSH
jgi:TPR repeat protein